MKKGKLMLQWEDILLWFLILRNLKSQFQLMEDPTTELKRLKFVYWFSKKEWKQF